MCFNLVTFIQDHQVLLFTCSPRKEISPWAQRPSPIPPSPSQNIPLLHNPCSLKTFWLCALPKKGFRHLRHILSLFILVKLLFAQRQWIRNLSPNISKAPERWTNQTTADVTRGIECSSFHLQCLHLFSSSFSWSWSLFSAINSDGITIFIGIGLCPSYTTQFSVNRSTPTTQNLQTGF